MTKVDMENGKPVLHPGFLEQTTGGTINHLDGCLDAPINRYFVLDDDPDVLLELLEEKRSPNTQRAYLKDLTHFFRSMAKSEPTSDVVLEFLHLEEKQAVEIVVITSDKCIFERLRRSPIIDGSCGIFCHMLFHDEQKSWKYRKLV